MNAQQQVYRVRRNYNRWVANQTLEDYALRFTAKKARRWSAARVSTTALGSITFLAMEAIGGAITLNYGFSNTVAAVMVVGLIIFLMGLPICYHAAKQGVDIDLLTRGAGFGYIGSTITSLIYASFTFIFFALEAAILALALQLTMDIPLFMGYVISALVVIPLVTHGITLISRFQIWTQPIWIVLQILPLACIAFQSDKAISLWTNYEPIADSSGFNVLAFGAASAVLFSLMAQIGEQVDFLRFLPKEEKPSKRWWWSLILAGPGWIFAGVIKILIGSFLAVLALNSGVSFADASDPNQMYLTAFSYLGTSPEITLVLVGAFVILSQLKINVTNAYAGSIAWSNFFSRLTHNHPGRVVWLVFNVAIALTLMELGIYRVLEEILSVYSILALAWIGSLVADLVINKPLKLRPATMEFKRAHLFDINPVGVGSMSIASGLGFAAHMGVFGPVAEALASFIALGATFICAPLIAWATQGRFYIARDPVIFRTNADIRCCICELHFEYEDMTHCPAYVGPICSLCCSLDSRCHDICKTDSRMADQLIGFLSRLLPSAWVSVLNTRIGHFLGLFVLSSILISSLLSLVYFQITLDPTVEKQTIASALTNVFFILMIISGVVTWMFSLVHESRRIAQEESNRHTELLTAEIDAHKQTDMQLQQAKEVAEAANLAKSRYLTGISHELRSPLNAIMGYAQLLEKDENIPINRRDALGVIRRSSEHLADLIEGLLDISRIEAGRLDLVKSNVHLANLLDQIVSMFQVEAANKGIAFDYDILTPLPETVHTDEKRLRQVLINLISNAIKYTQKGKVTFTVRYRNQVAIFAIKDSGIGIAEDDIERIFKPFERVRNAGTPHIAGTGLGLTITRLLIDIMGGDLSIKSKLHEGSLFKVSLMLSSTDATLVQKAKEKSIIGYQGKPRTVFVVDDEPAHRSLLDDTLSPLGFKVIMAPDGVTCLDMLKLCAKDQEPDIFLLDVFMPTMTGWELAEKLRQQFNETPILMISANANEQPPEFMIDEPPHDAYLVKPLQMTKLLEQLHIHAGIEWIDELEQPPVNTYGVAGDDASDSDNTDSKTLPRLTKPQKEELIRMARIGYAKGIQSQLEKLESAQSIDPKTVKSLRELASRFEFNALINLLEDTHEHTQ